MIDCRPAEEGEETRLLPEEQDFEELQSLVDRFAKELPSQLTRWQREIQSYRADNKRVIIWGGGSKGVAFLTTLGLDSEIDYVVDINPYKHDKYMPCTGHRIVGPEHTKEAIPDVVIVMNPIYVPEIRESLQSLGLSPQVLPVDQ